jgi:hypothetical protein
MHTYKIIKKLQKALICKGDIININTTEFYSDDKKRMITKYIVTRRVIRVDEDGKQIRKNEKLIDTCSQIEIVNLLVDRLKELSGGVQDG